MRKAKRKRTKYRLVLVSTYHKMVNETRAEPICRTLIYAWLKNGMDGDGNAIKSEKIDGRLFIKIAI